MGRRGGTIREPNRQELAAMAADALLLALGAELPMFLGCGRAEVKRVCKERLSGTYSFRDSDYDAIFDRLVGFARDRQLKTQVSLH